MKVVRPWTVGPLALLLSTTIRCWMGAGRYRFFYDEPQSDPARAPQKLIILFWHEMLLFPAYSFRHRNMATLVSQHIDGELIARVLKMLGIGAVRGSTTRAGMTALRGLMRQVQLTHVGITPDGPRGPRRVVQKGAIFVASRTGLPILPAGFAFRRCWRAGSWDRMAVPRPGTMGFCVAGKAIHIPPDIVDGQIESHRLLVQQAMDQVQARAEAHAASG